MNRPTHITEIFVALILILCIQASQGGSAIWSLNPGSGDWNTPTNWMPLTVPNGPADTATFALSNSTHVAISANTEVNAIVFDPGASAYSITASPGLTLAINGSGITNNSGATQTFTNKAGSGFRGHGTTEFFNNSTAGAATITNNGPAFLESGGVTQFFGSSSAGNATITNKNGQDPDHPALTEFRNTSSAANGTFFNNGGGYAGSTRFFDSSTAANGTFINNGFGASTEFSDNSSAGNGTFINNGFAASTEFSDNSSAGNGIFINNGTVSGATGGGTFFGGFFSTPTAANGTFINNGGTVSGATGGFTNFSSATAGNATITNYAAKVTGADGGSTNFFSATAGNATITNNGATIRGAGAGYTQFSFASAGNGTFINNGGTVSGAKGGHTQFGTSQFDFSTADSATLIANGGTGGGLGGTIFFEDQSTGGTSRIEVFGNGNLDISFMNIPRHSNQGVTVGSIEGDGNVFLGEKNLTVGSSNLSTTFSGVMQDVGQNGGTGGSLTKIGSGTLNLTGANTYTGNTNINSGVLQVDGSITSKTFVNHGGTLAGAGTVIGNVTNNRRGTVSPGDALGTLTVNNYTQMSGSTLLIDIAGPNAGQFSVLDVLGNTNVNPNALLLPVLQNGFVPTVGESFIFMDYSALSGTFSIFDRNIDNAVEHWNVAYQSKFAILTVVPGNVPVPDRGSTFLLLLLSLLALGSSRQLLRSARFAYFREETN